MDKNEVELSDGKVVKLVKPKAKQRNDAMIKAWEYNDKGRGRLNEPLFLVKLLPFCIGNNPFGKPVSQGLDELDYEDYDKVKAAFQDMVGIQAGDVVGKSDRPSDVSNSQTIRGSETSSQNGSSSKKE